ncbi:MAG: type II secretion system protein [Planctomycetota bacterium]
MAHTHHRNGYLLVELLAAITLLTILLGAVVVSITPRTERAGRELLRSRLITIDATARSAAIAEGPLLLRVNKDDGCIELTSMDLRRVLTRSDLGDDSCSFVDPETNRQIGGVVYDRLGRSDPFAILVSLANGSSMRVDFGMLGCFPPGSAP